MKYAVVTNTGTDAGDIQKQQVTYLGKVSECALINPYGHLGKPPTGSLALVANILGDEANKASITNAVKTRRRNLKDGETGTQNHLTGTILFLDADGNLVIDVTNDQKITVTGNTDLTVGGNATVNVTGNATFNVGGTTDITSTGNLNIDAPTTEFTGRVKANGKFIDELHSHNGSATAPLGPISPTGTVV